MSSEWLNDPNNLITIFGIIICIIGMVLMSIHARITIQNRKHIAFRKRFAEITIFVYFAQMLKQLSWMILLINNLFWYNKWYTYELINNASYHEVLWKIIRIPTTYCLYFCYIFGWLARFWMSTYNIHLTKQLLQNKWQSIINVNLEKNWYIKHKNTFGNLRFISIINSLLMFMIVAALTYYTYLESSAFLSEIIVIAIEIVTSLAVTFILYGIYQSIPVLDDNFFIYEELKRLLYVLIVLIIPLWLFGILLEKIGFIAISMKINEEKWPSKVYIFTTVYEMFCGLAQVIGVLVSTYWVNHKLLPIVYRSKYTLTQTDSIEYITMRSSMNNKCSINTEQLSLDGLRTRWNKFSTNNFSELFLMKSFDSQCTESKEEVEDRAAFSITREEQQHSSLYIDILHNNSCFEEFVLYLAKDYCMENVLGFIELIQFQQYIFDFIIQHPDDVEIHPSLKISLHKNCDFPHGIPKSLIVCGDVESERSGSMKVESVNKVDGLKEFVQNGKRKAFQLYTKYISSDDASYRMDISDTTRNTLDNWIQNEQQWMNNNLVDIEDLLEMFEDSVDECFGILADSYKRFMLTDKYQKLKYSNGF